MVPDSAVTRRSVLKGIGPAVGLAGIGRGAGSTGTLAALDGERKRDVEDETDDGRLDVAVWRERESIDTGASNVAGALEDFLLRLSTHDAIGDYRVVISYISLREEFGIEYDAGKCDDERWFDAFQEEIGDSPYRDQADIHVAVTDRTNFANARGECWGDNGPGWAYVGTAGGYPETDEDVMRYRQLAKQEAGHVMINEAHVPDSGTLARPEHSLGAILVTDEEHSTGPSTPMAAFYENTEDGAVGNPCYVLDEATTNGWCGTGDDVIWNRRHTPRLTPCTIQAVKETYEADRH